MPFNEHTNILVGKNEAMKSALLEAIKTYTNKDLELVLK